MLEIKEIQTVPKPVPEAVAEALAVCGTQFCPGVLSRCFVPQLTLRRASRQTSAMMQDGRVGTKLRDKNSGQKLRDKTAAC